MLRVRDDRGGVYSGGGGRFDCRSAGAVVSGGAAEYRPAAQEGQAVGDVAADPAGGAVDASRVRGAGGECGEGTGFDVFV